MIDGQVTLQSQLGGDRRDLPLTIDCTTPPETSVSALLATASCST